MRSFLFTVLALTALLVLAAADSWGHEDYEIFRLKDELELHEGPGVTFYDFVGTHPGATQDEIGKAYRKRSRQLHPDKAKASYVAAKTKPTADAKKQGKNAKPTTHVRKKPSDREINSATKEASDRFARLGLIAKILRGEGRERYDHFLSNGFPKWRGTGYYYNRFRPGLGSTLVGLFIFAGGLVHYVVLIMSWKRHREFVERTVRMARKEAWGDESALNIPGVELGSSIAPSSDSLAPPEGDEQATGPTNRRQKRMQDRESKKEAKKTTKRGRPAASVSGTSTPQPRDPSVASGPQGARRRFQAENGKMFLVDSVGDVYLEAQDEDSGKTQLYLLDPRDIVKPGFKDTILVRLPKSIYTAIVGRLLNRNGGADASSADGEGLDGETATEDRSSEEGWEEVAAEEEKEATRKVQAATGGALLRKKRGKIR